MISKLTLFKLFTLAYFIFTSFLFFKPINIEGTQLFPHFDKLAHCLVFLSLSFLVELCINNNHKQKIVYLACYGALVEIIQGSFFNREMSFLDWLADILGIVIFYFIFFKTKFSCIRLWVMAQLRPC
ncbi:VanZ family protein [Catenovulum maritimum]|uniref:VanZ-like domain-containing protein n=1 Tax=Catenovulum maritimum TaxID=1513271 RepID=A0A0J8JP91_9ALTE|nr:hypothetical protein XM47_02680 [Catenovulum maritimum]